MTITESLYVAHYSVFGLRVRSEIELPELHRADGQSAPDLVVRKGEIADQADDRPGIQEQDGALVLTIPDVARYRMADGVEIVIDAVPGTPERNIRLYLLGSALGAILHQRGLLPLHANAVEVNGQAVAFMGKSGAGKSTLAAWFNDQGFRVLSDDVCVVEFSEDGRPRVGPGLARLRLSREALHATGRDVDDYERSFVGDDSPEKYDVAMIRGSAFPERVPLAAVYLLDRDGGRGIEPITGVAAMEAAFANTYRGWYVPKFGGALDHWSACVNLVRSTSMFQVGRDWGLENLHAQSSELLRHAEAITR